MNHSAEMWLFVQLWLTPFLAAKGALMWHRQSKNIAVFFSPYLAQVDFCPLCSPHPHNQRPEKVTQVPEGWYHQLSALHYIPTTVQNRASSTACKEWTQSQSSLGITQAWREGWLFPINPKSVIVEGQDRLQRVTGFMLSLILMMQCFINWSFPEQHVYYQWHS